jgi:hypothetical protein
LHEYSNDFKYDCVVRIRTDLLLQTPLSFKEYDQSVLNYSKILNQKDKMICDWMNFGSSQVMDVFMGIFPTYENYIDIAKKRNRGAFSPEYLHRVALDCHKIRSKGHDVLISLPRF